MKIDLLLIGFWQNDGEMLGQYDFAFISPFSFFLFHSSLISFFQNLLCMGLLRSA